jgi:hypothetical protein
MEQQARSKMNVIIREAEAETDWLTGIWPIFHGRCGRDLAPFSPAAQSATKKSLPLRTIGTWR